MKLSKVKLNNFRGVKSWMHDFGGNDATITGENGTGKTSIFDVLLWILFDKNSAGDTKFDFRPHDENHVAIPSLTVTGEIELDVNGKCVVLKKENIENLKGGQVVGFTNNYWINGNTKLLKDFKKFITDELIPEDIFKMLADLSYFNSKMHHTDRRALLMTFAKDIGIPEGFEALVDKAMECQVSSSELLTTTIENYKKILTTRKKDNIKERDDIQPRIDERSQSLLGYKDQDVADLTVERDNIKSDIKTLNDERSNVSAHESARQTMLDNINQFEKDKIKRESVLENDTSAVKSYIDEKAKIESAITVRTTAISKAKTKITEQQEDIKNIDTKIAGAMARKADIVAEHDAFSAVNSKKICAACGQALPANKLKEYEAHKKESLEAIAERGKEEFAIVKELNSLKNDETKVLDGLGEQIAHDEIKLTEAEQAKNERFKILDDKINANETVKPADDDEWCKTCNLIKDLQERLGEPVTEQLDAIDAKKEAKNTELTEANSKLANFDNAKKAKERIAELSTREKELAQLIADIEADLKSISEFKTVENNMIEAAVNDMFKHVTFRMFVKNVGDDGVKDDCTAIYRESGTAYPDCSTGEKIIMGIDVVNVLSKHFDVSVPMFIDNAESLTKEVESDAQVIRLVADVNEPVLKVV